MLPVWGHRRPLPGSESPHPSFQMIYLQTWIKFTYVHVYVYKIIQSQKSFSPNLKKKLKKKICLIQLSWIISKPFIRSLSARTYSRTHLDMIQIIQLTLLNLVPEPGQGINHDPRHPGQSVLVPGSVQHNINILWAEFRSGKRGQFLLNQEEHVTRMWGFKQDTQGLDREICVLSRIYLCNPSLNHCQTGEDKWCYMQGNIHHITVTTSQEASVLFRFA